MAFAGLAPLVGGAAPPAGSSPVPASSVRYENREIAGPPTLTFHLVFFDESRVSLKVLEQPNRKSARSVAEVLAADGALAGCNGGYYGLRDFSPSGLQIVNGRQTGKLDAASVHNGVLLVRAGQPSIELAQDIRSLEGVTDLLQCSPVLVRGGKQVFGSPADTGKNTRTFIACDGRGRRVIGTCRNITLTQLGQFLLSPVLRPDFPVSDAMNLDGGPSSGLWAKGGQGKAHHVPEAARVKNIVALLAK